MISNRDERFMRTENIPILSFSISLGKDNTTLQNT